MYILFRNYPFITGANISGVPMFASNNIYYACLLTPVFVLKELELQLEETTRQLDDCRNQLSLSERKRIVLQQELEDARSLLEHVSH